jgi:hypothetical protein
MDRCRNVTTADSGPLEPPVNTVVPLDIVIDIDSIGVGTGVVELEAPITDLSIDIGALRGADGLPGEQGPQGEQGPPGPQGEPGQAGAAPQAYTHIQGSPSTVWDIHHNLGFSPANWHVEDSGGNDWVPADIENVTPNHTRLHWVYPFGGTAMGS